MPLELKEPTFDRSFDELFQELRSRIPRYNPAWTNFNESDPGITLLQLFAWLAEMTLHRMNDVPRKNYMKFAKLLGLQLAPARPATVQLTFTPKAAEVPSTIPAGARYSAQVEGAAAIVFETVRALDVIGAPLTAVLIHSDGGIVRVDPVPPAGAPPFYPFGRNPAPGDAIYLGFKPNPNNAKPFPQRMRFLALRPPVDTNGEPQRVGDQVRELKPPVELAWEYRPRSNRNVWQRLNVWDDQTTAFTRDGYIDVEGPSGIEPSVEPTVSDPLLWLRVRLDQRRYPSGKAPRLEYFLPNSVEANQLTTEGEYSFGISSGRGDQQFDFPNRPIDPGSLQVEVRFNGVATVWSQVEDFFSPRGNPQRFTLDATAGRITFGDGENGEIPSAGAEIVATRWRHGGGAIGNWVGPGAVKTMVTQISGIEKVTNVRRAAGGADEEDLDDFIKQTPARLRQAGRAVTERDFESLARSIDGVKAAHALGGRHPDYPDIDVPGAVTVYIVPDSGPDSDGSPPTPSAELIRSVCRAFDSARLITTEVYVAAPAFIAIRIEARILATPEAAFDQVALDARERLNEYLNPLNRGFGENVSQAAIYAKLFGSAGTDSQIRSVEDLLIYVDDQLQTGGRPIEVPSDTLVYPGDHLIVVRPDQDDRSSA